MKKLCQTLIQLLLSGQSVVLATIFHSAGSAPRSAGTKMIICADGSIVGTVGGGKLEAETIKLAETVRQTRQSVIQPFDLSGADAAGAGMILAGRDKFCCFKKEEEKRQKNSEVWHILRGVAVLK